MPGISPAAAALCLLASLSAVSRAQQAQDALLLLHEQPSPVPAHAPGLQAALQRVVAGPTAAERAAGYRSAVPADAAPIDVRVTAGRCEITLGPSFADLLARPAELELATEQLVKTTVLHAPAAQAVDLFVRDPSTGARTPWTLICRDQGPPRPQPGVPPGTLRARTTVAGALTGRTIVLSPGHGYYWHSTLGWTTQRPLIDGLLEDLHTHEIVVDHVAPFLEDLGARVLLVRERGRAAQDWIVDDDMGAPACVVSGPFTTSSSTGYQGGRYLYAPAGPGAVGSVEWRLPVLQDDRHPVYVWYRAGSNRSDAARYQVVHAGGTSEVVVDQSTDGMTWRHLGDFEFTTRSGAVVRLLADAPNPGSVVIADAARLGGGLGSIPRGGSTSGRPRWQEAARYWTEWAGAPTSVFDPIAGGQDNDDDVTARPRFAEWIGADAYVSLHTNAGGGTGTSSFIYNGGATAGSTGLQSAVHDRIVQDVRSGYDASWVDRGKRQANFGEVRLLSTMPGVLLELAFHDQPGTRDHDALHDPAFRRIAGRAIARGLLEHFQPGSAPAPDTPLAFRIVQDGAAGLALAWLASPGATRYTIEEAPDGRGFVEVGQSNTTSWTTGPLAPGSTRTFRVRAWSSSGRSPATEALTAGTSHTGRAELLMVRAFDRLDRRIKDGVNRFDQLTRHADAIRRADAFSLGFDAASNEAVQFGSVRLTNYRAVAWACGEESTQHESFSSLEQQLISTYLGAGGRLLASGSEIGWDLEARGSAADLAFFRTRFGARLVADDAGTYSFAPTATGGPFAGLASGVFDDGSQGTYDVAFPDVLAPADGATQACLVYPGGIGAAALFRDDGNSRVILLGFPLETIVDAGLRARVMERALRTLLSPRTLQAPESVTAGGSTTLSIDSVTDANRPYVLLAALGTTPGFALPDGALLPLRVDALTIASLDPTNPFFQGFQGQLDGTGTGHATFSFPNVPQLAGMEIRFSGALLHRLVPWQTSRVLPWVRITVRP